ncbi:hypothetical protein ABW21_db0202967 [Orbilia brochopaga]|nr:hypothetical protein ABW21_db0202967 [Drechslerella brochopaga]
MKLHRDVRRTLPVVQALHLASFIFLNVYLCVALPQLHGNSTATLPQPLLKRDDLRPIPQGDNALVSQLLTWDSPQCQLGLWSNGFRNGYGKDLWWSAALIWRWSTRNNGQWEGYPLSLPDNTCIKTRDLHPKLENSITQYRLTGYCECEFFDSWDCQGHLFNAFNRDDMQLATNGPDNDRISSFKCWWQDHYDLFESGRVDLFYDDKLGQTVEIKKADMQTTNLNGDGDYRTICYALPETAPGVPHVLQEFKVTGLVCTVYGDKECIYAIKSTGDSAVNTLKIWEPLTAHVASFNCVLPYGIPNEDWYPGAI